MLHIWIVYLHYVKNGHIQGEMAAWYKYSLLEHLGFYFFFGGLWIQRWT